ncbi:MAG: glycosyltransferase family 9 protein [Bdellovibrionales bacterium]
MKILVVSLLRAGDFLLAVPALNGLRHRYPKARLDVATSGRFGNMHDLLPFIEKWWVLDREMFQRGLGQAEIPIFTSMDLLRELSQKISAENYDLVINLTHTRFSAYWVGYLEAKEKLGLVTTEHGRVQFGSPWFRYLNERADTADRPILHYADIFRYGSEVAERPADWTLFSSEGARKEVDALDLPAGEFIAIQALTSDPKKNWGLSNWTELLKSWTLRIPIVLMGSPAERGILSDLVARSGADESHVRIITPSFAGAFEVLKRARLLVTGDTSIKHMANGAGCQIVELSLGSSDIARTGAYRPGSLIVDPSVECRPCGHSEKCTRSYHLCGAKLTPHQMDRIISHVLAGQWDRLNGDFGNGLNLHRSETLATGFWFPRPFNKPKIQETLAIWLDHSTHKFMYGPSPRVPEFGSEAYKLKAELEGLGLSNWQPVLSQLEFLEKDLKKRQVTTEPALPSGPAGAFALDLAALRSEQNRRQSQVLEAQTTERLIRSLISQIRESV